MDFRLEISSPKLVEIGISNIKNFRIINSIMISVSKWKLLDKY